jgi:hypothetical protein
MSIFWLFKKLINNKLADSVIKLNDKLQNSIIIDELTNKIKNIQSFKTTNKRQNNIDIEEILNRLKVPTLNRLKVPTLKCMCEDLCIGKTGTKDVIIERIIDHSQ